MSISVHNQKMWAYDVVSSPRLESERVHRSAIISTVGGAPLCLRISWGAGWVYHLAGLRLGIDRWSSRDSDRRRREADSCVIEEKLPHPAGPTTNQSIPYHVLAQSHPPRSHARALGITHKSSLQYTRRHQWPTGYALLAPPPAIPMWTELRLSFSQDIYSLHAFFGCSGL